MGGSQSTTSVQTEKKQPVIIEDDNKLDAKSFMLIDCNGDNVILQKEDLYDLAVQFRIPLDDFKTQDFKSQCTLLRRVIKTTQEKSLRDNFEKRPPLSIDVFKNKKCDEIVNLYSKEEWKSFYEGHKDLFSPWNDLLEENKSLINLWDIPAVCTIMRNALINTKSIPGTPEEQASLARLNRHIKTAIDARKLEKIKEIQATI